MNDARVPLLDLAKEYRLLKREIDKQLKDCFISQQWILGEKVEEFETKTAGYLGAGHALGVSSGTDALVLALRAMAVVRRKKDFFSKKDEVITTPFTFLATAEAIIRAGATPVFVDIDPDTFNVDPLAIKKAITKNTVGILPVHLYGLAADMDAILNLSCRHGLFVVEDAAQAFGAAYKNQKAGNFGDVGCFSFFPSKNLGGYGDGGLVATNDSEVAEVLKLLRNHGQRQRYDAQMHGYNARLDALQAAILLAKFPHIDEFNRLRQANAAKYNEILSAWKTIIKTPEEPKGYKHIYHQYTIKVFERRDELVECLNKGGIQARVYYPGLLTDMKALSGAKISGKLPVSRQILKEVISLPIYPLLADSQIQYIGKTISRFFAH